MPIIVTMQMDVLKLGSDLEVLAPSELRELIAAQVKKLSRI